MTVDLSYLEGIAHKTRSARFQAARRLRISHAYALISQLVASVALVFWSLVPVFYDHVAKSKELSLFNVIAAVVIFSIGIQQQAAKYIDRAASLEASGRSIDALRRIIQSDIMKGLGADGAVYAKRSRQYANALEENPVNHSSFDSLWIGSGKRMHVILLNIYSHLVPMALFLSIVGLVAVVPLVILQ